MWRWCGRAAGDTGIYPYLDNQVLADLIEGKQPTSGQTPRQSEQRSDGVHIRVRDAVSHDCQATVDRLRREIPAEGISDIVVAGTGWTLAESTQQTRGAS